MNIIQCQIKKNKLTISSGNFLTSGNAEYVQCRFAFDEDWNGLVKTAVFYQQAGTACAVLLDDSEACMVPAQAMLCEGMLYLGVTGAAGGRRIASEIGKIRLERGAYMENLPSITPAPDVFQQMMDAMQDTKTVVRADASAASTSAMQAQESVRQAEVSAVSAQTASTAAADSGSAAEDCAARTLADYTRTKAYAEQAVSAAQASVTQADRAKSEADRASSINAYSCDEADKRFASALLHQVTGSQPVLRCACADSVPERLTAKGRAVFQKPDAAAEAGPNNLQTVTGVGEKGAVQFTVSGSNLFDLSLVKASCVTAIENGFRLTKNGSKRFTNVIPLNIEAGTQVYFSAKVGGTYATSFCMRYTFDTGKQPTVVSTAKAFAGSYEKTIPAQTSRCVGVDFYLQAEDADGSYIDVTDVHIALVKVPFEPYYGEAHTCPVTAPLYALEGGLCDEMDLLTGIITRRIEKRTGVNGDELYALPSPLAEQGKSLSVVPATPVMCINCSDAVSPIFDIIYRRDAEQMFQALSSAIVALGGTGL